MQDSHERVGAEAQAEHALASSPDTGLICLLILARFYDLPADGAQLRHQFAQSGQVLSDTDLLRAAKHLGLKGVLPRYHGRLS